VANKPILWYAIENLIASGIHEIGLVVGGVTRSQIQDAIGDGDRWGASITYLSQEQPRGLAHAVGVARDFVGDRRFVVYLGDNIIREGTTDFVRSFPPTASAQVLVARVPDPQRFGVVIIEGDNAVRLVEKPTEFVSDHAIVGVYAFTTEIFDAIGRIAPSARGELEITDAIQRLVDDGKTVRAHRLTSWWADTGRPEDVLDVSRRLLLEMTHRIEGDIDDSTEIVGTVQIGAGTRIRRSILRGPLSIGANCVIEDCYVGPYTSVSDGCELRDTEIEYSILMAECRVVDMPVRIDRSLLGNNVSLVRKEGPTRTLAFILGDDSQAEI
jgi:glucose-1-phosphate thymidylyltransferase